MVFHFGSQITFQNSVLLSRMLESPELLFPHTFYVYCVCSSSRALFPVRLCPSPTHLGPEAQCAHQHALLLGACVSELSWSVSWQPPGGGLETSFQSPCGEPRPQTQREGSCHLWGGSKSDDSTWMHPCGSFLRQRRRAHSVLRSSQAPSPQFPKGKISHRAD